MLIGVMSLVLFVGAAAAWGWSRVRDVESASSANERRLQLAWLARSAARAGLTRLETTLPSGDVIVTVRPTDGAKAGEKRVRADATGAAGTATLVVGTTGANTTSWTESFARTQ